jgi:zinc finger CCHC domain-containing protein 9
MTKEDRRQKYTDIARNRRAKQQDQHRKKDATCYHCRQQGHFAADCPTKNEIEATICYKCGSTEHGLSACPKRNEGNMTDLPYATCFLCKEKGHLISQCPQNSKGVFVNGGECRHCGSKQHLATKCPEKSRKPRKDKEPQIGSENIEDLLERDEPRPEKKKKKNEAKKTPTKTRKVVKF